MAVTAVPMIITTFLPALSAIFPEKNLDSKAPNVNKPTIYPNRCPAPMSFRYPGNSGIIIPKLAINITVLEHRRRNVFVKSVGVFFTSSQRYLPYSREAVLSKNNRSVGRSD